MHASDCSTGISHCGQVNNLDFDVVRLENMNDLMHVFSSVFLQQAVAQSALPKKLNVSKNKTATKTILLYVFSKLVRSISSAEHLREAPQIKK